MTYPNRTTELAILIMATAFVAVTAVTADAHAGDWPHWRGPDRNDVVKEPSHYHGGTWLPDKPAWSGKFGLGTTSPIVVDGTLYIMGSDRKNDTLFAVDAATGKTTWEVSYPSRLYGRNATGDQGFYAGPCSTPEFDAATGYIYTLGIDGHLMCWDTRSRGRKVWEINLYDRYDAPRRPRVRRSGQRDYGYTTSPLVHGEMLVVEVGAKAGNLIGFAKRSGKQLWASEEKDPAGHNGGPVSITVEGVPCAAVLSHNGLLVVRLDRGREGKTVAKYPWLTDWANNIVTPTVKDNFVLLTSGYNFQAMCKVRITLAGATKVWQTDVFSKVCSPVVYNGHIYWAWRDLYCLDWETGKEKWRYRGNYSDPGSCIVTGDGRLILWAKNGRLALAETADRAPTQPRILEQHGDLFRQDAWPHVVLADGRLFCKDRSGEVKCFVLRR